MTLGFRARLFGISLVLIASVAAISGLFLETVLRGWLEERLENDLARIVRTVRVAVENHEAPFSIEHVQPLAERLGEESRARITVIGQDGVVRGDSALPRADVGDMDNHGKRPEVLAAQRKGLGVRTRHSRTVGAGMLYVAVPFERAQARGVVRAALPLSDVDALISRLRVAITGAVLLGLLVAIGMGAAASHFASRRLVELVARARALAGGASGERIEMTEQDELAGLAGSFNHMADELDRAVRDLGAERDRVEAILESLEEAVLVVDADNRVSELNQAGLQLFGLDRVPAGVPLVEVVRLPELSEVVARAQQGDSAVAELDWVGPPVKRLWVSARLQRTTPRCVVVLRDITELRRLENVRREFVANVSHELRTPVSIIRANAETLLGGALSDPERARSFVDGIERNADRLSRLIHDLLDLSRIEAGRYAVELATISAEEPVGAIFDLLEHRVQEREQQLQIDVDDDLRFQADSKALEQVLLNLVDNAVKYTPEGGELGLSAFRDGDWVQFVVWDTGPGVAPRHRERLFERFYRIDPGRSRDMGGTGLGLSIVKHLVESMGGQVGMEPREGGGSRFWVKLRVA